jgi:hypothetical protein
VPSDTTDAATDQPDAATAVDAGVDAAVDLPAPSGDSTDPPGPCNEGTAAPTCHSYRKYKCVGTAWVWQTADQMCCQDARFKYDQDNRVVDSKTGLKWDRNDANGLVAKSVADSACQSYGRLPTTAELMGILIGPPKDGTPTCTPMVDRSLFFWEARPTWTSDGCVDLATGKVVTCTTANLVCVVTK